MGSRVVERSVAVNGVVAATHLVIRTNTASHQQQYLYNTTNLSSLKVSFLTGGNCAVYTWGQYSQSRGLDCRSAFCLIFIQ